MSKVDRVVLVSLLVLAGLSAAWWVLSLEPSEPLLAEPEIPRQVIVEVSREIIVEITREVPVTVVVTREMLVEVTRQVFVTTTPEPTATAMPTLKPTSTPRSTFTPEPTPTPAVEIPATWKEYENMTGEFTLWYPPEWALKSEAVWIVGFDLSGYAFAMVAVVIKPRIGKIGDEQSVNDWVRSAMKYVEGRGKSVRLLSKGAWRIPSPANYAEFSVTTTDYRGSKTVWHHFLAQGPADDARYVLVAMSRIGSLRESEIEALKTVVASMRVRAHDQPFQGN